MRFLISAILLFLLFPVCSRAQNYSLADSIRWFENGKKLRAPYAGGTNMPQFSPIDLDGDGLDDLFVFDREGNQKTTYLNGGTANQIDYIHAPQYQDNFPDGLQDWVLLKDFNCDGKADLFTWFNDGIRVYRNTGTVGNPSFSLEHGTLQSDVVGAAQPIFITKGDLPSLEDIDGDGDMDILVFDPAGTYVEFHKNMALENGSCDSLQMTLVDRCWGHFQESGLSNTLTLNVNCKAAVTGGDPAASTQSAVHAGSTLLAFDVEGDGAKELLIGDLLASKMAYLHNGGTAGAADMDTVIYAWPDYDTPIDFDLFPSAFHLDVNNDQKPDIIAAPTPQNVGLNYASNWFYQNSSSTGVILSLAKRTFLQDEMVDVGSGSYPVFFDYDQDGLEDLVIGNVNHKTISGSYSGLTLYRNLGPKLQPRFELVSRDWQGLSTVFSPTISGIRPAFGDLDGDGDEDLLIGDSDGALHLLTNTAGPGNTASFALGSGYQYMGIDIGQFATPVLIDLNQDGKLDIVVGEMGGTLNYFENTGTLTSPAFGSSPTSDTLGGIDVMIPCCTGYSVPFFFQDSVTGTNMLVGNEKGNLFHYGLIDGNVLGTWTLLDSNYFDLGRGYRTAPAGTDLNGNGTMEVVVGDYRGGIRLYTEDVMVSTGSSPAQYPEMVVFPNPAGQTDARISIFLEDGSQSHLHLLSLDGRNLGSKALRKGWNRLIWPAADLPPGIYLFRLDSPEGSTVRKWVKLK